MGNSIRFWLRNGFSCESVQVLKTENVSTWEGLMNMTNITFVQDQVSKNLINDNKSTINALFRLQYWLEMFESSQWNYDKWGNKLVLKWLYRFNAN